MIKLSFFLKELNDLYEHYGDIGVDCKDFQVEVTEYPDKDETYLITFSPAKELESATVELCEEIYERNDSGFYHPSHVYLDSLAKKINEALGNA